MTLTYGFTKSAIASGPTLKASRRKNEIQYHLHAQLDVNGTTWEVAINVGTNDADDLLKYRLVYDFHHAVVDTLKAASTGFADLTGTTALPAFDFQRSDILAETGKWRESDVMDGTDAPEPAASLKRLLIKAQQVEAPVYVFGRRFEDATPGIHDVHQNQGSTGGFLNNGVDDHNDHNDIWQDGAVLVDLGNDGWAGYFTAFTQQLIPTDELGNPMAHSEPV
ncbi:MAG: DUF2278 family protein [Methylocella sp.]|jgi:uncharacterized protein YukJ